MTTTLIGVNLKETIENLLRSILIILDKEGVLSLNDNAQESMVWAAKLYRYWKRLAPKIVIVPTEKEKGMTLGEIIGTRFFQRISNIDDIWGDFHKIAEDPSYSSGHTLKVILAFLSALGINSQGMRDFAYGSLRLMPNINKVLPILDGKYTVRMVSTSYEFFIQAFCQATGFDFEKCDCTFVPKFGEIPLKNEERLILLRFMKKVAVMPLIEYDEKTGEVKPEHQKYYDRITDFIWETLYNMPVGEMLRIVHPVGQAQKREAVERRIQEFQVPLERTMGLGDSQTDVQWAQLLQGKGLVVMFNGKGKVCRHSDIMYIGDNTEVIEEIADLFAEGGREAVLTEYSLPEPIRSEKGLLKSLGYDAGEGGLLVVPTKENIEVLEAMSVQKRKEVRGVHIAELT
jgi:predicted HAD superfamily phosphohydrolase